MVSIPHYEDLSAQAIYDSLDLMWWPSEKLDGSYLLFGLDSNGSFFSQRKGGDPCYTVDDWPDECWSSTYRIGHTVGAMVVEALVKEGLIKPGQSIGSEIIQGSLPNTVSYAIPRNYQGVLVITAMNFTPGDEFHRVFNAFRCNFSMQIRMSPDGLTQETVQMSQEWLVKINPQLSRQYVAARLSGYADNLRAVLDHWFPKESKVAGFTVLEVLDINLSKKHPLCGERNWNDLKKELSKERSELKEILRSLVLMFKDTVYRVLVLEQSSCIGAGSFKEGVVISSNQGLFKIVDCNNFQAANRFTHIVKYWLIGGRRPARPSFLSRTKNWPKEKRLARLEVLRERYCRNRYSMHHRLHVGGRTELITYSGQLHQRTLNMFSDTRKRIEDGR